MTRTCYEESAWRESFAGLGQIARAQQMTDIGHGSALQLEKQIGIYSDL
jgi:hypothetical protein